MRKEVKEIIVKDDQNFTEILRLELPITVEAFEESMIADDAVFGYVDLVKYRKNEILGDEAWRGYEEDTGNERGEMIKSLVHESWMRSGPIRVKMRSSLRQRYQILDGNLIFVNKISRSGTPFSDLYFLEEELRLSPIDEFSSLLSVKIGIFFSKDCPHKDKIKASMQCESFQFYKSWIEISKIKNIFGPKGSSINLPDTLVTLQVKARENKPENFLEKIVENLKSKFIPPNFAKMTVNDKVRAMEGSMKQIVFNQAIIIMAIILIVSLNFI